MPAVLRVEGLGQDTDLCQLIQPEEKSGSTRGRIAPDWIGRIHTVDQEVRHTRTDAINRDLPDFAVRKQRRRTAGVRSDSRLQHNRTEKISVIEGQFRQALPWKLSFDGRCRVINPGSVRADRRLLLKIVYRELRIDRHRGSRSELNSFA